MELPKWKCMQRDLLYKTIIWPKFTTFWVVGGFGIRRLSDLSLRHRKYMPYSSLNVDPMSLHRSDYSKGDVGPSTNDISVKRELRSGLISFLNSHCTNTCPTVDTSMKRKRSSESHWTTDDENIIHEGRIGCGGLGDVHRVLSPRRDC